MRTITYDPATHVLVPKKLTEAMTDALQAVDCSEAWAGALTAAPEVEPQPQQVAPDPAAWVLIHNGQTVQEYSLTAVLRLGRQLRTEAEQLTAANNLFAALEQERLEELIERRDHEHPEITEVPHKLAATPAPAAEPVYQSQETDEWGTKRGWVTHATREAFEARKRKPVGYGVSTEYRVLPATTPAVDAQSVPVAHLNVSGTPAVGKVIGFDPSKEAFDLAPGRYALHVAPVAE